MATQTQDQDQDTRQDMPDPFVADLLASGKSLRTRQEQNWQQEDTALEAKQKISEQQAADIEARGKAKAEALPGVKEAAGNLDRAASAVPQTPDLPKPPDMKRHPFLEGPGKPQDTIKNFLQSLAILAAPLTGILKGSGITAAASMNGAMKGWMAGDDARVQREMDTWKASTDHIIQTANAQQEHYKSILESAKISFEMKKQALALVGMEFDDKILADATRKEGWDSTIKLMEDRGKQIETLQQHQMTIWMQYQNHKDMQTFREEQSKQRAADLAERTEYHKGMLKKGEGTAADTDPESVKGLVDLYIKTGEKPTFGMGKSKKRDMFWDEVNKRMTGDGGAGDVATSQAIFKANKTALNENTKRETLIRGFVNRIDMNIKTIRGLEGKYGKQEMGRMLNAAQNMVRQKTTGSGDLEPLRLALISTSNEVAKIESGSLGIAGAGQEQMAVMEKIHDLSLNTEDLEKVLDTSLELGKNSIASVADENKRLQGMMSGPGKSQESSPVKKTISGKTYYKVGEKWHDNPEGK